MRILQINAVYHYGSTGRNVYQLHHWLLQHDNESYVIWTNKSTATGDTYVIKIGNGIEHKIHAIVTRITGGYGYASWLSTCKLCRKIDELKPNIVHLHNLHSNNINFKILFDFLGKRKIPVVITLHDCWYFTGKCYSVLKCTEWINGCTECSCNDTRILPYKKADALLADKKILLGRLDRLGIIGVSNYICREAKKSFLTDASMIECIYNWIDISIFAPRDSKELKENLHISNKSIILGVANSWVEEKGITDFIKIAEAGKKDWTVLLVGNYSNKYPLPENIIHISYTHDVKELSDYYNMADVFVNPSRAETFGKVTAEALACGTPAVVYDNTGTRELVADGCGFLAKDGDIEEMIEKISDVIKTGKEKYRDCCRRSAVERFSPEVNCEKHLKFYTELLNK